MAFSQFPRAVHPLRQPLGSHIDTWADDQRPKRKASGRTCGSNLKAPLVAFPMEYFKGIKVFWVPSLRLHTHFSSTTLIMIFSVIWIFFQMTLLMIKFISIVMDDGWVHPLAKILLSLINNLWLNIVMDDSNLDDKSLGRWQ